MTITRDFLKNVTGEDLGLISFAYSLCPDRTGSDKLLLAGVDIAFLLEAVQERMRLASSRGYTGGEYQYLADDSAMVDFKRRLSAEQWHHIRDNVISLANSSNSSCPRFPLVATDRASDEHPWASLGVQQWTCAHAENGSIIGEIDGDEDESIIDYYRRGYGVSSGPNTAYSDSLFPTKRRASIDDLLNRDNVHIFFDSLWWMRHNVGAVATSLAPQTVNATLSYGGNDLGNYSSPSALISAYLTNGKLISPYSYVYKNAGRRADDGEWKYAYCSGSSPTANINIFLRNVSPGVSVTLLERWVERRYASRSAKLKNSYNTRTDTRRYNAVQWKVGNTYTNQTGETTDINAKWSPPSVMTSESGFSPYNPSSPTLKSDEEYVTSAGLEVQRRCTGFCPIIYNLRTPGYYRGRWS